MGVPGYAILLDVTDRQAVVVGGGAAAVRKVRGLLAAGAARIRVVSPEFHQEMPRNLERIQKEYRSEHLAGAKLVIAATDNPQVNEAVVRDARRIGALVSRIDSDGNDHGDFILPAVWREGNLSVAVSTGHAPALARLIRDGIGEWIDPRWVAMTDAMAGVRPIVMQAGLTPDRRREIFHSLISDDALETAAQEGSPGVLRWLAGRYPDLGLPPARVREKEEL
jgi:precorrin-2 dehydrogenase/sirohydrochlorin ferrochelatase